MSVIVSLAVQLLAGAAHSAPVVPACSDADATSFLATAAITDTTTVNAVCTLTQSLKSSGLWTLMDAIYPFVGGTSASNSFNLKNPSAYRITWNGGVTFSANGVTGDGSTGYGDTGFAPRFAGGNYSQNYASIGVVNQTSNSTLGTVIGAGDPGSIAYLGFNGIAQTVGGLNSINAANVNTSSANGFMLASRTVSGSCTLYATDGSTATNTDGSTSTPAEDLYLLANDNNGVAVSYAVQTLSFAFIGGGLTGTQVAALQTAVTTFNTALGR